jgi:hypothetical protein
MPTLFPIAETTTLSPLWNFPLIYQPVAVGIPVAVYPGARIYVLTSRPGDNIHLTAPICNAPPGFDSRFGTSSCAVGAEVDAVGLGGSWCGGVALRASPGDRDPRGWGLKGGSGRIQGKAARHGRSGPNRGPFSCPIPQRQPHVVNLDGARRYRCLVQGKIVVTRPPPILGRLTSAFRVGFSYSGDASAVKGRTHAHESADRGRLTYCADHLGRPWMNQR